jgi:hypothetical protein
MHYKTLRIAVPGLDIRTQGLQMRNVCVNHYTTTSIAVDAVYV